MTALQPPRKQPPQPPRLQDVLGVAALPPAAATRATNRVRGLLGRLRRGIAPPPARIMESVLAGLEPAVLAALCRMDLPDRITGPVPIDTLAGDLDVAAERLARLLRFAHTRGWLRLDRRDLVHPTRLTPFLRREHPGGWRAWVEFSAGQDIGASLAALEWALPPDGDAFAAANDLPFFAFMAAHPERRASFDAAMAAGARMHGLLLARAVGWSASRRVCDVGGGDGTLLSVLIAHHPHLQGVVLELPEVVARMPHRHRVTAQAGDAFQALPADCDTYLLVNVLHDWDDAATATLLSRAAEAARNAEGAGSDARVIVVDSLAGRRPTEDLALLADTLMLALTPGGRERTVEQFVALGEAAGLRRERHHRLASGDVAIVFRRGRNTPE
jgi:hypothetical protein